MAPLGVLTAPAQALLTALCTAPEPWHNSSAPCWHGQGRASSPEEWQMGAAAGDPYQDCVHPCVEPAQTHQRGEHKRCRQAELEWVL